ncbi:unnamed protein product, partial [Clonostachys rosea f. rosea IK726]
MAETYARYIDALERERANLTRSRCITSAKQNACIDKIMEVYLETETDRAKLAPAIKSRRKAAHNLMHNILAELGVPLFFVCALALPITSLASIKNTSLFVKLVQEWWNAAEIPPQFGDFITDLRGKHSIPEQPSAHFLRNPATLDPYRRTWSDDAVLEEQSLEANTAKRRKLGQQVDRATEPRTHVNTLERRDTNEEIIWNNNDLVDGHTDSNSDDSDDNNHDDGEGTQEFDRGGEEASADAPLGGKVYKLKVIDAIRILVNVKDHEVRLMMPNRSDLRPLIANAVYSFITFSVVN